MKKVYILLSIFIFVAVVVSSFLIGDKVAPVIEIKSTPMLNEDSDYEDLINYVEVYDEDLKSIFIENINVSEILDKKQVTYVAIDNSNNITKLKSSVDIDPKYATYHIACIKDPNIQVNTKFNVSDYFELQNEYGIRIEDKLKTNNIDTSKVGDYEIEVSASSFDCEPINATVSVTNENAPTISLTKDTIDYYTYTYWSDNDFLGIIDSIEDDKDSSEYLLENTYVDWKEVLDADDDGYVSVVGSYTVTYTVIDSDNNEAKTTVEVILDEPIQPAIEEESVGE